MTVATLRTVLVIVRSPAALNRLLDVLAVFDGDTRVDLVFAVDHGSRFSEGLTSQLISSGARVISWEKALSGSFDLALAASDNGDLHRVTGPLVLLPHGVGYQRFAAHEPGAISGLRPSTLIYDGQVVPTMIMVSHPGQLDIVRAVEPRLLPRAVVAGDLCFDRLRHSARHRDRYRAAFETDGKRLVVLCSTWGPHSLFGRQPDLPHRVVAELETDQYRTALVLHPNVWARHGPLQLRIWLRPALDAGLVLVPPDDAWRAALAAADVVVSDHSSLTCYAAAVGAPVILAEDGGPEVVPGSPIDLLRRRLPRLRRDTPVGPQLEGATAPGPDVAEALFAHPGQAMGMLRAAVYQQLGLTQPDVPVRLRPVPVPDLVVPTPTAYAVQSELDSDDAAGDDHATVVLHRFPAVTYDEDQPYPRHLAADDAELDPGWAARAAVVWHDGPHSTVERARQWATATTTGLPAVRVVVTSVRHGRLLVVLRDGRELLAEGTADASMVGSAIHCCVLRGVRPERLRSLTITAGITTTTVRLARR